MVRNGEVQKILDFLTDGKCENNADWKYRFKENSDKMRTGSLLDVAVVLKGLLLLAQAKPLSFREKKMLERTRYLLVSELAMAKNWRRDRGRGPAQQVAVEMQAALSGSFEHGSLAGPLESGSGRLAEILRLHLRQLSSLVIKCNGFAAALEPTLIPPSERLCQEHCTSSASKPIRCSTR